MIATPQKYLNFLSYLTTVFDNVEDFIVLIEFANGSYNIVLTNERFAEQAGQPSERLAGRTMQSVLSAEQFAVAQRHYERVRLERQPQQFEYTWSNGKLVEVACYPVENALGEPVYLVSIGRDVSALRQTQQRQRELEAQMELLAAATTGTVLIMNAAGVVEVATGGGGWWGHGAASPVGKAFDEVVQLADSDFARLSPTLPATGRAVQAEGSLVQTDDTTVPVHCELRRERGKAVTAPRVAVVVRAAHK